jgi:uncharacterized membrane protein YkoI
MSKRLKGMLTAGAVIAALGAGGAAIAGATGGGDESGGDDGGGTAITGSARGDDGNGTAITGNALERAKAAALRATGGGEVTATEVRDEEGYYEVEVRRDGGSQVDVHLDRNLNVLDVSGDGSASGDGGPNDD